MGGDGFWGGQRGDIPFLEPEKGQTGDGRLLLFSPAPAGVHPPSHPLKRNPRESAVTLFWPLSGSTLVPVPSRGQQGGRESGGLLGERERGHLLKGLHPPPCCPLFSISQEHCRSAWGKLTGWGAHLGWLMDLLPVVKCKRFGTVHTNRLFKKKRALTISGEERGEKCAGSALPPILFSHPFLFFLLSADWRGVWKAVQNPTRASFVSCDRTPSIYLPPDMTAFQFSEVNPSPSFPTTLCYPSSPGPSTGMFKGLCLPAGPEREKESALFSHQAKGLDCPPAHFILRSISERVKSTEGGGRPRPNNHSLEFQISVATRGQVLSFADSTGNNISARREGSLQGGGGEERRGRRKEEEEEEEEEEKEGGGRRKKKKRRRRTGGGSLMLSELDGFLADILKEGKKEGRKKGRRKGRKGGRQEGRKGRKEKERKRKKERKKGKEGGRERKDEKDRQEGRTGNGPKWPSPLQMRKFCTGRARTKVR
ncbi:Octapeptide-repeat protein T2, partial [Ophiophagus hannah]